MGLQFDGFNSVTSLDSIVGLTGGENAICTRSDFKASLSLDKGDVGLGNVDNTSDTTKNAASVTLTNKTIDSPTLITPVLGIPSSGDITACSGRLFGVGMALSGEAALTTGAKGAETIGIACQLVVVYLNTVAAPTGSAIQVDIKKNGSTIFSVPIYIDAGETNSGTAATSYALLTTPTPFSAGDVLSYHVDQADSGSTATFLVCDILLQTT